MRDNAEQFINKNIGTSLNIFFFTSFTRNTVFKQLCTANLKTLAVNKLQLTLWALRPPWLPIKKVLMHHVLRARDIMVGGGKRQWKHHPIYVQQEERFQFSQRISPPHTHTVCPPSVRSLWYHKSWLKSDWKTGVQDSRNARVKLCIKSSACGASSC